MCQEKKPMSTIAQPWVYFIDCLVTILSFCHTGLPQGNAGAAFRIRPDFRCS
jgi:hypothetical protein